MEESRGGGTRAPSSHKRGGSAGARWERSGCRHDGATGRGGMVAGGRRRSSGKSKTGKSYGGSPKAVERSEAWGGRKRSALKGKKQCGWLPRGLGESRAGRPRRQNVSRILRRAASARCSPGCLPTWWGGGGEGSCMSVQGVQPNTPRRWAQHAEGDLGTDTRSPRYRRRTAGSLTYFLHVFVKAFALH